VFARCGCRDKHGGRRLKFAPLHWDLPSGKADKGEAVTAAAARELKEETGLVVDPASLKIAGIIQDLRLKKLQVIMRAPRVCDARDLIELPTR
jgi:8-oxo-dGTP pyrophosphatase MutT (NUDIX family)